MRSAEVFYNDLSDYLWLGLASVENKMRSAEVVCSDLSD